MTAPEHVWVCGACGKFADERLALRDSSCVTHAVLCHRKSLKLGKNGMACGADAVEPQPE